MTVSKLRPSFTFTEDRLAELRALVPEAFADGKVKWDVLREALGEYLEVDGADAEHFGLSWPGKREARRLAAMPSNKSLVPVPGEGKNEDTTRNIFIEGDNLEVLKLLQKSYAGQVKLMYIDPPYNTGNDLLYRDDYAQSVDEYLNDTHQSGDEMELLTTNPKASGRYHSNWLSMMYPRLRLDRTLLSDAGAIFVSIDDHEAHHLRELMNEVFGEENFVACIANVNNPKGRSDDKYVATAHEYLMVFRKSDEFRHYSIPTAVASLGRAGVNFRHAKPDSADDPENNPIDQARPGEYRPDPTEGIQRIEDLPKAKIIKQTRNYTHLPCPECGRSAYRDRVFVRPLHDIGDLISGRPRELQVTYSQHHCSACNHYFPADLSDLAPPRGHYTHRVVTLAVRVVVEDGLPYRAASWHLWRDHRVFVPFATIQNWVEAGGKKGR